ncbi:type I methionyl aminopeptidase [Wolbachia endosymbiont of Drosophila mauritiana]|nr:type I methionyl aminopeptidase [Wolbachia endosymbiont of Drosophila mauritiana]QCB63168.1 type I methionyl aminopeptidase [Wolbachia endosymbiont of Drosophila mauritiana]QWE33590.1 Methionine aminopeptidase [Wolbachia endosymbiont of Drosophila simulans]TGB07418.1 type I methionyl aminopeptidase [Wolbachia endosymbiont of Drosophila mauritiana]
MNITIHSQEDFDFMRKAGRLAAETLDFIAPYVKVGLTTNELNDLCHDFIINAGAIPAPLNYKGYPKSICTSKNAVVCHGIPDDKPLKDGDILNIDVTVILNGWYGDTSRMFWTGKPSIKAKRLCNAAYNVLMEAIKQVKPGNKLNEIGFAIEKYIEDFGYSIVRNYCGHGIGKVFHAPPNVVHFYDEGEDLILKEGMFFTVEPMINAGKHETLLSKLDGWTVTTRDLSLSAQFEHTLGVTKDGVEIFTLSPKNWHFPPYD